MPKVEKEKIIRYGSLLGALEIFLIGGKERYKLIKTVVYRPTNHYPKIDTEFFKFSHGLGENGMYTIITIKAGFTWDGATGPVVQDNAVAKASLLHDVLYCAMFEGHLPWSYRDKADKDYVNAAIEAGMWRPRAYLHYAALKYIYPVWNKFK